jgi:hypothetical protein
MIMTQEEKLEEAKRLYQTANADQKYVLESLFPELVESEDERIRRGVIEYLQCCVDDMAKSDCPFDFKTEIEKLSKYIDWLEKQGEQKSADKVEPKFKVGDWIIFNENHNSIYQVERIDNYRYYLRHYLGGTLSVHFDNELIRQWNIQDAKDGDILMANAPFIFNGNLEDGIGCPGAHCAINTLGKFQIPKSTRHWTGHTTIPATKEQRDLLFQKMKEAGYDWDAQNKELKRIEQLSS